MTDEILIGKTVKESYGFVWRNRRRLALPMAFVFLFHALMGAGAILFNALDWHGGQSLVNLVWVVAMTALLSSFVVGLHRTVMLDETRTGLSFLHWDSYLWSYFKAWLKFTSSLILAGVLLVFVVVFIGLLAIGKAEALQHFKEHPYSLAVAALALALLLFILLTRLSLAFPAAALGLDKVFRRSWALTRNSWPRLLATLALALLPVMLINLIPYLPMLSTIRQMRGHGLPLHPSMGFVILFLINAAAKTVATAVLTVALSLCYTALAPRQNPPE